MKNRWIKCIVVLVAVLVSSCKTASELTNEEYFAVKQETCKTESESIAEYSVTNDFSRFYYDDFGVFCGSVDNKVFHVQICPHCDYADILMVSGNPHILKNCDDFLVDNPGWERVIDNSRNWYNGCQYNDQYDIAHAVGNDVVNEVVETFDFAPLPDLEVNMSNLTGFDICNYTICFCYPDDINHLDEFGNVDFVESGRTISYPYNYYLVRGQYNGIPIFSDSLYLNTVNWSDDVQGFMYSCSESPRFISDGYSVIQFSLVDSLIIEEIVESDLQVIPFEDCVESIIDQIEINNRNSRGYHFDNYYLYGAELVYVLIGTQDFRVGVSDSVNNMFYMVPVWTVYYYTGTESGDVSRSAIYINAITGEGIIE